MKEISGLYFFLNEKFISSEIFNDSFLEKGINVYEVLRFVNDSPLFYENHFKRLLNSSEGKNLCPKINAKSLLNKIQELLGKESQEEGNLKIVLHSESIDKCDIYIYLVPHVYPSETDYKKGVKLITIPEGRPDPNLKNWRPNFRKKIYSLKQKSKAFDVLLIENGKIREGSQSNFFMIFGNKIVTASGDNVLKGITREIIFQICDEENITLEELNYSMEKLKSADSVFLSGTSPGILPVSQIDELIFQPTHPILEILMKKYKQLIQTHYIN